LKPAATTNKGQLGSSLYRNCLPTLFSRVVGKYADRTALLFEEGNEISYRQLDMLSNQAARFLFSRGLRRGDRVCLHLEKSVAAYSLVLGCIKTGITYFATDPASPGSRIESIFAQCSPDLIFAESAEEFATKWHTKIAYCCAGSMEFCADLDSSILQMPDPVTYSDPAYIMFTSGSTGVPKGAVITHSNLHYFVDWAVNEYGFTVGDRHTHLNPLYFDNSVFDMYSTFFSGGTLVPFTSAMLKDPIGVVDRIERLECSVFFSVPSMLIYLQTTKAIEKGSMKSLRKIIFGGEGYPKTKLAQLYEFVGEYAELINVYGPTECTCICSTYTISAKDFETLEGYPPIGSLTYTFSYYLLNGDIAVSPGEVGELCLGGPCVGHGYFNQPELTNIAFVQNPPNTSYVELLYRTGDLMRLDPLDGKLWFIGRKDFQVKHQGYRIELEEIEHGLAKIKGVDEAAVVQVFDEGTSRLIGFAASSQSLQPEILRRNLADLVPKYMVPSKVFVLGCLPKNPNGKIDRKKLLEQYSSGMFVKEKK
jgi:D-alanine--poly(phosphoribitol) ligase subunit 1